MIVIFALAIGTLGPAPEAPTRVDADCVRTEQVVPPKRRKPGVVKARPRLFKSEPKPIIEEDCGEGVLPPAPSVELEPVYGYSPIPFAGLSLPPVPGVETPEPPCECFGGQSGLPVYLPAYLPLLAFTTPGQLIPAVPEPEVYALTLVGLGLLAGRLWTLRTTRRTDKQ